MNFFKALFNCKEKKEKRLKKKRKIDTIQFDLDTDILPLSSIYSAFEQFGEIKNITICQRRRKRYGFVEFLTSQDADADFLKRPITIRNQNIILHSFRNSKKSNLLTEVDRKVKIDDTLLHPPNVESPNNILNALNDDCLYEIFKRIHHSNYVLIGNVCVRFSRIVKEMVGRKYKNNMFYIRDMQSFTLLEAERYLRYFGSSIYHAEINFYELSYEVSSNVLIMYMILIMISEYCVNLRYFHTIDVPMDEQFVNEIIPLFMRIEKLIIKKQLMHHNLGALIFLPSINCPNLVDFEWNETNILCAKGREDIPALINFLNSNTQLRTFQYSNRNSNNYEEYCLLMNTSLFGQFKYLKSLSIHNGDNIYKNWDEKLLEIKQLVQELTLKNVPIEFLKLYNTVVSDAAIEYISQINTIRKFAFVDHNFFICRPPSRDVIESYIIRLKTGLQHLEFLQFQVDNSIDIIFTEEHVTNIGKQSPQLNRLKQHIEQFNDSTKTFCDKYNLTTIEMKGTRGDNRNYRLLIRKYPATGLNVQHYWLTLIAENDNKRHLLRFPFLFDILF